MSRLGDSLRAGRVRRWHMDPDLSETTDLIEAHQGRVARLILALHPDPSRALLAAALTHDDGEIVQGDLSGPAKARLSREERGDAEAAEHRARAGLWRLDWCHALSAPEDAWLRFADRLDAVLWMLRHRPELANRSDWSESVDLVLARADALGVRGAVEAVLMGGA